jgi:methylenetetrahydrofolate reductase (NADPH)
VLKTLNPFNLLSTMMRGSPQIAEGGHTMLQQFAFELVPLKSLEAAIEQLPPNSRVSVTCSPAKGIAVTQELTGRLIAAGHHAVPHISARQVEGPGHAGDLAAWCRDTGVASVFIVGGDADPPAHYGSASAFIDDFLSAAPGIGSLGITGYPDHHASIGDDLLHTALHDKQRLIIEAGIDGWVSTQMCFDHKKILRWLERERSAGLTLSVHLGLAGVVDRAKLMSLGVRLGIGESLAYLQKNRASITRMMMPGGYDPTELVAAVGPRAAELKISGVHCFTFNFVAETEHWRQALLAGR